MPWSSSITTPNAAGPGLPRAPPSARRRSVLHETELSLFLVREARFHVLDLFRHLHQLGRVADAAAHQLSFPRTELGAVILSRAVRFAQPSRRGLLRGAGSIDLLFEPDNFG